MPLRAVFFDFDGLILDTEWPEVETWSAIYKQHGHEFPDYVWKGTIGRGSEQEALRAETLLSEWTGLPKAELKLNYQELRMQRILTQPILPGVEDLLSQAKLSGIRIAAVSSSDRAWVEGHLTRLGLWHYFERSFCSDDVTQTKPFPELYLLALSTLGLRAAEVLVFEDSPNGVAAARAAGIRVIACPNPVTSQLDLSAADIIVDSLAVLDLTDLASMC